MAQAVGRTLNRIPFRAQEPAVLGFAAAVLLVLSGGPLIALLGDVTGAGGYGLSALANARPWVLFARSIGVASATTALCLLIGIPLGLAVAKGAIPGRAPLLVIHAFPVFLPPFLLALGWFLLLEAAGFAGFEGPASALFGVPGLLFVLVAAFAPIVTVLVALGVQGVDASLVEAARVVAGPWETAFRILLPAAAPAVRLSAIVVFALAFGEMGVPAFLRVETYPPAVFARLAGIDYAPGEAVALALPALPLALGIAGFERRWAGKKSLEFLGLRSTSQEGWPQARRRITPGIAVWMLGLAPLLPLFGLATAALRDGWPPLDTWLGEAPLSGITTALSAGIFSVAFAAAIGHALARGRMAAALLDALAVLAFVTPATVLSAGMIAFWNRPSLQAVYTSPAILVAAYSGRYAALAVRAAGAAFVQVPRSVEEAGRAAGAGYLARFSRLLIPLRARALGAVALLVSVFCFRDLETVIPLYPPGGEPLAVRIFSIEANGPPGVVAAASLVHVGLTATLVTLAVLLIFRRSPA